MRRLLGSLGLALAVAAGAAGGGVAQDPQPPSLSVTPESADFVPGELLVRFKTGVTASEQAGVLALREARIERALRLPRLKLVRLPKGRSVEAAAAALTRRPEIAYAEPNWIYRLSAVPNDPRFGELWGLHQASDADIDAPEAWDTQTGSADVVVAVIDSGIAYDHPDLAGRVWSNPGETGGGKETDGVDNDGNGLVDDHRGYDFASGDNDPRDGNEHGTHVAGTIGAVGNNALGVAGVNWDVRIMPLQACGPGPFCVSSAIVNAVVYAGAKGADVANMSIGSTDFSQAQRDAIAAAPETLFVAAAGNEAVNNDTLPQYPCNHPLDNVICVAASTDVDGKAGFSNFGPESVDLFAPGQGILSTVPAFDTIFFDDFEGAANWDYVEGVGNDSAAWERTTEASASPTHSLTDSEGVNYANNSNVAVTLLTPFSLSGRDECRVDYALRFVIESFTDTLNVEAATSAAGPWTVLDDYDGATQPPGAFGIASSDLAPFEGASQVFLRFRLISDFTGTFDGAYVDDVRVLCPSSTYAGTEYGLIDGTSMASPHVAGAAALLKAEEPGASPGQLKAAILQGTDPVPAFDGLVGTGGRLNLAAPLAAIPTTLEPPPTAQAALDTTFDSDGRVTTPIGTGTDDRAFALARQADGKIVLVGRSGGDFAVVRYNPDGSLDNTFGTGGKVTTTVGSDGPGVDEARAVAIQGDRKILVAGVAKNTFFTGDNDFAVVRYNDTDGSLDTTFGDGDGIAFADNNFDDAWAMALQPDGKIVVAGKTGSGGGDSMVARFNADGTLDTTFDGDGKVVTVIGPSLQADRFHALALQGDGKIVAAGFVAAATNNNDFAVARYNANGSLDTTFDDDGIATTPISTHPTVRNDEANAVVVQGDGKIVAAGESLNGIDRFALVRYDVDGSLDTSFDGDGKVQTTVSPVLLASRAWALGLQGDGKLVAAGTAVDRFGSADSVEFALARYNPDGTLDPSFNGDGRLATPIAPDPETDTAQGVAIQPDGTILAGGWSDMSPGASTDFDFSLVRYRVNGDASSPQPIRSRPSDPASPANDTMPSIRGSAEAGSTVNLYTSSDCTGPPVGTGTAASFLSPGFEVTVPDNATTTFRATATDSVGNTSSCSDPFAYVADSQPPDTTITAGPSGTTNDSTPTFEFSSEPGSTFECRVDAAAFADCTSPHTTEQLPDGPHNFHVQATDAAGNVELIPATQAFVVETAPDTTIDSGPAEGSLINDSTPTFTFSSDDSLASFECRVAPAAFASCSSPHTTAHLNDGARTFEVRAVSLGTPDPSPASRSFTVDTDPPETIITGEPVPVTNDATPSFFFTTDEGGVTFTCQIDAETPISCTSPFTASALDDDAHTFTVTATDQAGNADPTPATRSFTVDTDPPETTIDAGTNGPTRDRTPEWNFSSDEAGATFECRLVPAAFAACTSPHETAALADGPYTFEVRARDAAGNFDPSPASRSITVDTDPPETTIDSGPANGAFTNDSTPTFEFSSEPGASFQCRVAPAAFATCLSPHTTAALADGARTFDARATDAAGNIGAAASRSFTVDTDPPDTTIDSGPANGSVTNDSTATFEFSSEPGASFQCRVAPAAFATCASPFTTGTLADGARTFDVRATDAAGNTGAAASRSFTVDTDLPETTIILGPDGPTHDLTPEWGFTSDEPGGTFECRLLPAAFAACSSPNSHETAALADGPYTFEVRAKDAAGNVDGSPEIRNITVDTVDPTSSITFPDDGQAYQSSAYNDGCEDGTPDICGGAADVGSGVNAVQVSVQRASDGHFWNGSSWSVTDVLLAPDGVNPWTLGFTPDEDTYTVTARAIDNAGNVEETSVVTFTVDDTAPQTAIASGPSGATNDSTPTFTFSSEPGSTFQCRLIGPDFTPCATPFTPSAALADGPYTLEVVARDAAGNVDPTAASQSFTVDTDPPDTTITAGPGGTTNVSFSFTSDEAGSFLCVLDGALAACSSPASYSGLAPGMHTFQVTAVDLAGNPDPSPASATWEVAAPPPPPPPPPGGSGLPFLTVADTKVKEGNTGTKSMVFLVKLSAASVTPVTFGFATKPGTAKPKQDFLGRRGTLAFAPGQTVLKLVVKVKGDRRKEKHEKFQVVLASAVGATIADGIGVGTIRNND